MTSLKGLKILGISYLVVILNHTAAHLFCFKGVCPDWVLVALLYTALADDESGLAFGLLSGIWASFLYGAVFWQPLLRLGQVVTALALKRVLGSGWGSRWLMSLAVNLLGFVSGGMVSGWVLLGLTTYQWLWLGFLQTVSRGQRRSS